KLVAPRLHDLAEALQYLCPVAHRHPRPRTFVERATCGFDSHDCLLGSAVESATDHFLGGRIDYLDHCAGVVTGPTAVDEIFVLADRHDATWRPGTGQVQS